MEIKCVFDSPAICYLTNGEGEIEIFHTIANLLIS